MQVLYYTKMDSEKLKVNTGETIELMCFFFCESFCILYKSVLLWIKIRIDLDQPIT